MKNEKRGNAVIPLEFRITSEVMSHFVHYKRDLANEVQIRIGTSASEFRTPVSFDVALHVRVSDLLQAKVRPQENDILLLECWILWPPMAETRRGTWRRHLLVQQLEAPVEIRLEYEGEENGTTRFYLVSQEINNLASQVAKAPSKPIRLRFESPAAFFSLGERPPYGRQDFSLGLRIPEYCSEKTLVFLEYPNTIALRVRRDNARYHSLTLGLDRDYERKTTYFDRRDIEMRYAFGTTDVVDLSAPALPAFRAGPGIVAAGIALHLFLDPVTRSLSGPFFVLALVPWFIEAFLRRRLFSSSSVIEHQSIAEISTYACLAAYACVLALVAVALRYFSHWWLFLTSWYVITVGGVMITLGLAYLLLLQLGLFLRYACDRCERRLPIRKMSSRRLSALRRSKIPLLRRLVEEYGVWFHEPSRRILCTSCWDDVRKEEKEDPSLQAAASSGRDRAGVRARNSFLRGLGAGVVAIWTAPIILAIAVPTSAGHPFATDARFWLAALAVLVGLPAGLRLVWWLVRKRLPTEGDWYEKEFWAFVLGLLIGALLGPLILFAIIVALPLALVAGLLLGVFGTTDAGGGQSPNEWS